MTNVAIFASGSGSNAENIINYFSQNNKINIAIILSNKKEAYVHQRAKILKIKSLSFSNDEFKESDKILNVLAEHKINFIVLAGFMIKVPTVITEIFKNKIINIHPALLPKYGGKGMYGDHVHKAIVDNREKETGITIHYVNQNYDEGDILFQIKCNVEESDNYLDVAKKVHNLEYKYYPQVIEKILG